MFGMGTTILGFSSGKSPPALYKHPFWSIHLGPCEREEEEWRKAKCETGQPSATPSPSVPVLGVGGLPVVFKERRVPQKTPERPSTAGEGGRIPPPLRANDHCGGVERI